MRDPTDLIPTIEQNDSTAAMKKMMLIAGLIFVLLSSGVVAQSQMRKPISERGLLESMRIGGLTTGELVREVQQRGVDFLLTMDIEARLRRAGAAPELIRALRANRRTENAPVVGSTTITPKNTPPPNEPPRVPLGLVVQDLTPSLTATLGMTDARGVLVSTVEKESLADKAGVERRDVIAAVNDAPIKDTDNLRRQIARLRPNEAMTLTILRDGSTRKLSIGGVSSEPLKSQGSAGVSERGTTGKGRLGLKVEPLTPELIARLRLTSSKGLVVTDVDASGPAATAGIKTGDVIEEVNGQTVHNLADVETALGKTNTGRARLRVKREGKSQNIDLQPRR